MLWILISLEKKKYNKNLKRVKKFLLQLVYNTVNWFWDELNLTHTDRMTSSPYTQKTQCISAS